MARIERGLWGVLMGSKEVGFMEDGEDTNISEEEDEEEGEVDDDDDDVKQEGSKVGSAEAEEECFGACWACANA